MRPSKGHDHYASKFDQLVLVLEVEFVFVFVEVETGSFLLDEAEITTASKATEAATTPTVTPSEAALEAPEAPPDCDCACAAGAKSNDDETMRANILDTATPF